MNIIGAEDEDFENDEQPVSDTLAQLTELWIVAFIVLIKEHDLKVLTELELNAILGVLTHFIV